MYIYYINDLLCNTNNDFNNNNNNNNDFCGTNCNNTLRCTVHDVHVKVFNSLYFH